MFQQLFRNMPDVVKNLLIINVLMLVATWIFETKDVNLIGELGLFYFDSPLFEPYQTVSHFFMHADLFHLFFNMFALVIFGSRLEGIWGPKRFLIFFLVTAFGAALLHQGVQAMQINDIYGGINPGGGDFPSAAGLSPSEYKTAGGIYWTPAVGASGAIFGILIAFAMYFPNTELMLIFLPIPIKAKYFVMFYVAIELYLGWSQFEGDNIAHFAHLGGALFGFILVKLWSRDRSNFY